jgi:hypothetical protein
MKTLRDYLTEAEEHQHRPQTGDVFQFELEDGTLLETYVMDQDDVGDLLLDSTDEIYSLLEQWDLLDDGLNEDIDEAKYQGHEVPLGKPMRGDVKKFKVYVRNPKTGNIKKVNFGHGGTSAKRAGQKTMRIKKSNPARRKSFRARHHCENPGPRTSANYWSCRNW